MVELIRSKKMAGRAVLLAGPPGTGKVCKLFKGSGKGKHYQYNCRDDYYVKIVLFRK